MSRRRAERHGRRGEFWAALYLRLKGWKILARRIKTPRGEIDLVARRGAIVAVFEVKWRASSRDRDFAIDAHRLRRVAAATEAVAHRYLREQDSLRIDVLLLAPRSFPRHIVNAWQP